MKGTGGKKKKQDISEKEMRSLISAMDQPQFRDMLSQYIDEISDPKGREQYEKYLTQQEQRNDLPPGTKLIRPSPGFCLKTMAKKIVTHASSEFFEQKVFINICASDEIAKPSFTPTVQANGEKGQNVSMPYHYSQGRPDRDANNALCYTYDCVFNPRVIDICHAATPDHNFAFKKFVCDTAIDGLNKILSKHNQKASGDYKIMVNMKCKGGKPATLSVKINEAQEGKQGFEMDPSKHKTKLEKDINKQISQNKTEEGEKQADQMADVDDQIPFTDEVLLMEQIKKHGKVQNAMEQKLKEEIVNAKKPVSGQIIEPSYRIVEKYGVDYSEFFGKDQNKRADNTVIAANAGKKPSQLEIKIFLPTVKSIKKAELDINEREVKFKYKDMFQLVKKLPYVVDADKGSAKYDKSKQMLLVNVPVANVLNEEESVGKNQLIEEGEDVQAEDKVEEGEGDGKDQEVEKEKQQQKVIDIQPKIETQALEQMEKDNEEKQKQLNQMKDQIKFFPSELKSQDQDKPKESLIQQVSEEQTIQQKVQKIQEKQETLNWQTSERIESDYTFKQTSELIFILLNIKKYNKEQVHYILTEDELFLQVWDPNQQKIQKTCIQLTDIIIPENSKVECLNQYISVKMQKQQKGKHWNQIGINVSEMKPIQNRRINSNFIGQQHEKQYKEHQEDQKNNEISDEQEEEEEQEQEDDKKSETTLETSKVEERLARQQGSRPKPSLIPLTSELILQIS